MKRALPIRRSIDALTKAAGFSLEGRPLTARAVAELCGVELKTVHNWVLEGRLTHFRTPGRHLRFPRSAVHEFLLACGYEQPSQTSGKVSAVVVTGGSKALRTVLRGFSVTEVADLPSALIGIGRSEPTLLVVELAHVRTPPDAATLKALASLVPAVRVVLFGKLGRRPRELYGAQVVDGVTAIVALIQSFTSR